MPKISELPAMPSIAGPDLLVLVDKHSAQTPETKYATAAAVAAAVLDISKGVKSDTTVAAGSTQIKNIISLTQTQYNNIVTPSADTLYVIVDA